MVELQAAEFLQHGHTVFLGATGINGGLVDDDVTFGERFTDSLAGFDERSEVGIVESVNRSGHGNDVGVHGFEFLGIGGEGKTDFLG